MTILTKKMSIVLFLTLLTLAEPLMSQKSPESDDAFQNRIQPLLNQYCAGCHGPKTQKGDLRLDKLDPDILHGKDAEAWQLVLDQLNLGKMPPKKPSKGNVQPKSAERRVLVNWLTDSLARAAELKKTDIRGVMRRLTKEQYANTLKDLLKLDVDFGVELPAEGLSTDGFKNNGEEQVVSLLQTEYFLKIAGKALAKASATGNPPVSYRYLYTFGAGINKNKKVDKQYKKRGSHEIPISNNDYKVETFENRHADQNLNHFVANDLRRRCYADLRGAKKKRFKLEKMGVVLKPAIPHVERGDYIWLAPAPSLTLQIMEFPTEGEFVLRVKVAKADPSHKEDAYIKAFVGERLDHGHDFKTFDRSVKITGTPDHFQTIEFRGRLENFPVPIFDPREKDGNTMMIMGVWNDCMARAISDSGPSIIVKSMEFQSPYIKSWPPQSHGEIFIPSSNKNSEEKYSKEIIQHFMAKAFRRPVISAEVDDYHNLWKSLRPDCDSFEQSIIESLAAVLCSPKFLYLVETPPSTAAGSNRISETQLASRLSYFLWNSMPDDELLKLAQADQLRKDLPSQVNRMIKDPKSRNFIASFSSQWLQIEKMATTKVDRGKFPRFNRFVRDDMIKETQFFFAEVLDKNLSIMNFIDADFTMLNQNLAQFYGLGNVKGGQFRKVQLSQNSNRGGLLSQGVFLTGNSNGKEAHPIKRGAWLISRMLDDPPPPPPPNVPQINEDDPDIAKLSIKEQLKMHRDNPSCVGCHSKVDPWGLLFENYDAVGLWKQRDGISKAMLPDGTHLDGVGALKQYLLTKKRKDQFTRGLVRYLLRFALGRSLSFTDNPGIDDIVKQVKQDEYKIQSLLTALITSPLFSGK